LRSDLPAEVPAEPAQPENTPGEPAQRDSTPGEPAQPEHIRGEPAQPENISGEPPGPEGTPAESARRKRRTGRNLPAAVAVGLGLGGIAILTLFTVKVSFLAFVGVVVALALWELDRAVTARQIRLPVIPIAAGGAAAFILAYWQGERAVLVCIAITMTAVLAWRLPGGTDGYLRDVTAGAFTLAYLPLAASFVGLMLAPADGSRRTLVFLILTVCSDVGGFAAGITVGRHLMAPAISPKKTWEGFAGSALFCLIGGAISLPLLLHGAVWQGLLLGGAVLAFAALGDLVESMIKRDLGIKDMGTVLPGHGGILDRIDALLITAPVTWLLLLAFIPVPHR
jgi:phosphatidate cytidylyltransferase